jgi:hypothetical protein
VHVLRLGRMAEANRSANPRARDHRLAKARGRSFDSGPNGRAGSVRLHVRGGRHRRDVHQERALHGTSRHSTDRPGLACQARRYHVAHDLQARLDRDDMPDERPCRAGRERAERPGVHVGRDASAGLADFLRLDGRVGHRAGSLFDHPGRPLGGGQAREVGGVAERVQGDRDVRRCLGAHVVDLDQHHRLFGDGLPEREEGPDAHREVARRFARVLPRPAAAAGEDEAGEHGERGQRRPPGARKRAASAAKPRNCSAAPPHDRATLPAALSRKMAGCPAGCDPSGAPVRRGREPAPGVGAPPGLHRVEFDARLTATRGGVCRDGSQRRRAGIHPR